MLITTNSVWHATVNMAACAQRLFSTAQNCYREQHSTHFLSRTRTTGSVRSLMPQIPSTRQNAEWLFESYSLLLVSLLQKSGSCCKDIGDMTCSAHHGTHISDLHLVTHYILQRRKLVLLHPVYAVNRAGSNGILRSMRQPCFCRHPVYALPKQIAMAFSTT